MMLMIAVRRFQKRRRSRPGRRSSRRRGGRLHKSRKYVDVRDTVIKHEVKHIAGYSLGGALADQLSNEFSN